MQTLLKKLNDADNKVCTAQEVFTNKLCELLGITRQELEEIVHKTRLRRCTLYLPNEGIYLIASTQHILGWNTFFHITKADVCIHNISHTHAFDLHNASGTASYSFTDNQGLINKIYESIEKKDFQIITTN